MWRNRKRIGERQRQRPKLFDRRLAGELQTHPLLSEPVEAGVPSRLRRKGIIPAYLGRELSYIPAMTQDQAKPIALRLFREWAEANGKRLPITTADAGILGFYWMRKEHPEALAFRSAADKWQVVHIWLREAGFVTE
jgi:hypothetical protein